MFKYALTITAMPQVTQKAKEKYTPVIIILYLPVFISVSRPKTGNKKKIKQYPTSPTYL